MNRYIIGILLIVLFAVGITSCKTGGSKRISPPTASIQELKVDAQGNWQIQLRLQNYSAVSSQFDDIQLEMSFGDETAATLKAQPALSVGPSVADIVNVSVTPQAAARLYIADALASKRGLNYQLKGTIKVTPQDKKQRSFEIKANHYLNPVPGLDGVLRQ